MKKIFSIFAMAAVVLASCVKEQAPVAGGDPNEIVPSGELVEKVFTVGDVESKTYIDGTVANNKIVIKWCADDAISVWDGVANRKFTMVGEPNGASATFKGLVDANATDFYAIYPYDENLQYSYDEANQRMVFTVNKPAVQYANPEGGLADGSAYACGKADADGMISFVNRSVLLKFSLAESMNVKSLKISGNEADDIIAGTLDIRYTVAAGFSVGWKSAGKSTELTFCNEDGSNLKTGVDYYISLIGNKFDKGYAVTLTFDDGTSVTRDSDKSIQYMSNQIYSLASQPLSMSMFEAGEEGGEDTGDPLTSYYAAYTAGQDIMIAGKVYNKATYGEGTLVKAGETKDLTDGGKVYFVEPGAISKIGPTYSSTKYIVIGDDPTQRTTVTQDAAIKVGKENSHYAFLNLHFNSTIAEAASGSTNDVITIANSGSTIDRIAYDNCHIELTGRFNIYNSNSVFKDIAYHNCDFVVTVVGHDVNLIKCDSSTSADYQSLDLQNNLFWHSSAFSSASYAFNIVLAVNTNALDNIVMKNNTFVNLRTRNANSYYFQINNSGSYTSNGNTFEVEGVVDSAVMEGNIIYIDDNNLSGSWNFLRANATTGSVVNNYAYYAQETTNKFYFGGKIADKSMSMTTLTSSPFTSLSIDSTKKTCTVVNADAYKNYGASR